MLNSLFVLLFIAQIDCNDNLFCTEDTTEYGTCKNKLLDGYCLINNICYKTYDTSEDGCGVCLPAKDPYRWSNNANDDLVCTEDSKDSLGNCLHILVKGFCLIEHHCIIDGTKDINGCRKCDTSVDPYSWTSLPAGTPCNDGDGCTKDDRCDGEGECRGEAYICDDNIQCTDDLCDGKGGCISKVKNNYCLIDNQCIEDLQIKDGDGCKYCNVLIDQYSWTSLPNGTRCNDNDPETPFDYCNGKGECRGHKTDPFIDASILSEDVHSEDSFVDINNNLVDIEREGCSCTAVH